MPNFFNKYPYTDFHELNLDWVLETVKRIAAEWAETLEEWHNTQEEWQQLYDYVHDYFDNLDVQQEINNKLDAMALDGSLATIAQPIIDAKVAQLLPSEVSDQIGPVVASQIGSAVADQIGPVVADQVVPYISPAVASWLADHITNPSNPPIDTSLSVPGSAADAKVVGDTFAKCLKSSALNVYHNHLEGMADADDCPDNSVVCFASTITSSEFTDLPIYQRSGTMITLNFDASVKYGRTQIYITENGIIYTRLSAYSATPPGYTWLDWNVINPGSYGFTASFASVTNYVSPIVLQTGTTYGIKVLDFNNAVTFYIQGDTTHYAITDWYNYVEFTPVTTGLLYMYNIGGDLGTCRVEIYEGPAKTKYEDKVHEYTVGPSGDFTEITACFEALRKDPSKKIIKILGGEYDIVQEYIDNNIPICPINVDPIGHFIEYNAIVPTNSHIIGIGNVVMKCFGDPATWSYNQGYSVSALNILGSCIIENITIHAKNCRYCVHGDPLTYEAFNKSTYKFKNVKFIKEHGEYNSGGQYLGTPACTGFGFNPYIKYEFENCVFLNKDTGGTLYGHNRNGVGGSNTIYNSPYIKCSNCAMIKDASASECIWLDVMTSGGPDQQIITDFLDCSINGSILVSDNHNHGGTHPNVYDITMIGCSSVSVDISDAANTYIPKVYTT